VTPMPNKRNEVDGGSPSCLQMEHKWPAAPYRGRSLLIMKALVFLPLSVAVACCSTTALADSYDMPLSKKVRTLPVIAEVRIERIEVRPDPPNKFEDLLCDCEILQAFKVPFATNRLTLRMNFAAAPAKYEGKKVVVFAFKSPYGHYSPFGGKLGFISEGEKYHDRDSRKEIEYSELIRQVKLIIKANEQDGANGRQPPASETNRAPSAATSRRSP
jgi:hypothetical protein